METIKLEDGTLETILIDDADYQWATDWIFKSPRLKYPTNEMVTRLKQAIIQYTEVESMLDELLGKWRSY